LYENTREDRREGNLHFKQKVGITQECDKLNAKYHMRYTNDFIVLSDNKEWLKKALSQLSMFLQIELKLLLVGLLLQHFWIWISANNLKCIHIDYPPTLITNIQAVPT
jgi:hypothetical protein